MSQHDAPIGGDTREEIRARLADADLFLVDQDSDTLEDMKAAAEAAREQIEMARAALDEMRRHKPGCPRDNAPHDFTEACWCGALASERSEAPAAALKAAERERDERDRRIAGLYTTIEETQRARVAAEAHLRQVRLAASHLRDMLNNVLAEAALSGRLTAMQDVAFSALTVYDQTIARAPERSDAAKAEPAAAQRFCDCLHAHDASCFVDPEPAAGAPTVAPTGVDPREIRDRLIALLDARFAHADFLKLDAKWKRVKIEGVADELLLFSERSEAVEPRPADDEPRGE